MKIMLIYSASSYNIQTTLRSLFLAGIKLAILASSIKYANNSTPKNKIWTQYFRIFGEEKLKSVGARQKLASYYSF